MLNSNISIINLIEPIGTRIVVVDSCIWMSLTDQNILFALNTFDCIQLVSSIDIYNELKKNIVKRFKDNPDISARKIIEKLINFNGINCLKQYNKNPQLNFEFADKDIHVVALALAFDAKEILTSDHHFLNNNPKSNLENHLKITALKPDDLYLDILNHDHSKALNAFRQLRNNLTLTVDQFIQKICNHGLKKTACKLKKHKSYL